MIGIVVSSRTSFLVAVGFLMVWWLTVAGVSEAQVVIEERVVIEETPAALKAETSDSTLPRFGTPTLEDIGALQKTQAVSCSAVPLANYVPCEDWVVTIGSTVCDPACDPPPDNWTVVFIMHLHDFSDTTYTWLDDTTDQRAVPVSSTGSFEIDVLSNTWWGVAWFDVVLLDKNGQQLAAVANWVEIPIDLDDDGIADGWEDDNGGKSTLNQLATCVSPSAECTELDMIWDEEQSSGNDNDGDGFSKMAEYQGVMIGDDHYRLSPEQKEVFLDISQPVQAGGNAKTAAEWAAQQIEGQLSVKTYWVQSIEGLRVNGSTMRHPGATPLEILGSQAEPDRGYVKVVFQNHMYPAPSNDLEERQNGDIVHGAVYSWGGTQVKDDRRCFQTLPLPGGGSQPWNYCQPVLSWYDLNNRAIEFAGTSVDRTRPLNGDSVTVYQFTISNLYGAGNDIIESVPNHTFWFGIADSYASTTSYTAYFDTTDANQDGVTALANPFDLLSHPRRGKQNIAANSTGDNAILGVSELDLLQRTTLHEIGHALGIWVEYPKRTCTALNHLPSPTPWEMIKCHPELDDSVMRGGVGPSKTIDFSPRDKKTMHLKK